MLKKRIIPIQLIRNEKLVKSVEFDRFRHVGNIVASSKVYNSQTADELIVLDITPKSERKFELLCNNIKSISNEIFMPLAAGGGVENIDQARQLINFGADKVIINSGYFLDNTLIYKIANEFGRQAVILSIDVRRKEDGWGIYSNYGRNYQGPLSSFLECLDKSVIGELFIQSIDNDGKMNGFDLDLYKYSEQLFDGQIIAAGGCGNYQHLLDLFNTSKVNASACGSIFNFTDSNLIRAKSFLYNNKINVKRV